MRRRRDRGYDPRLATAYGRLTLASTLEAGSGDACLGEDMIDGSSPSRLICVLGCLVVDE
jgi:hypothetical protein